MADDVKTAREYLAASPHSFWSWKENGEVLAWVDGKGAFEKTDVRMRDVDTLKIEAVWLNLYLGGSWTARTEHHLYIDDVVIARGYIGPL